MIRCYIIPKMILFSTSETKTGTIVVRHVKWMLSKMHIEQDVKDYLIAYLKDVLCILSIDLHSGMKLVHFPELSSL